MVILPNGASLGDGNMRSGILAVAASLLAGCATNAIRIDRGTAVGAAGQAAVAGTRGVLAEVDSANRDKLVAVAALDPACDLPSPVIAGPSRREVGVCVPAGQEPARGDFRLARFDSRAFAPALATLQGLSAYLGAIDEILTTKRPDVGADVDDAIVKLQGAASSIGVIVGVPIPTLLADEQRKAVTGALSLLSTLANEARTVDELRRLETPARDIEFQETLARLRAVDAGLLQILRQELQEQGRVLGLTRRSVRDPRESRREEMGLIERRERIDALEVAMGGALDALGSSRDSYLELLRDGNAPLTRDERAKRARLARDRVLSALNAVAGLVKAF